MFCRISIATSSSVSARDIVQILDTLPPDDFRVDIALGCDSLLQSGQLTRRIREEMQKVSIDPERFTFMPGRGQSAGVEIWSRPTNGHQPDMDEHEDLQPIPPTVTADVGDGDFMITLRSCPIDDSNGRSFAHLTWDVTARADGSAARGHFDDRVMIFPPNERARYFATALRIDQSALSAKLGSLTGATLLVRRRKNVQPDGSEKFVNHYFAKR